MPVDPKAVSHEDLVRAAEALHQRVFLLERTVLEHAGLNQRLQERVAALEAQLAATHAAPFAGGDVGARLDTVEAQMESLTHLAASFRDLSVGDCSPSSAALHGEMVLIREHEKWATETIHYCVNEIDYWRDTWNWVYSFGRKCINEHAKKTGSKSWNKGGAGEAKANAAATPSASGQHVVSEAGGEGSGSKRPPFPPTSELHAASVDMDDDA